MGYRIEQGILSDFTSKLRQNEKSAGTIRQYQRSVEAFAEWLGQGREFGKQDVVDYKAELGRKYKLTTANSYIVSLNAFFKIMGWYDCCLTTFRLQKRTFRDAGRELTQEEYRRLLRAAGELPDDQLFHIILTIACTGIRISELSNITVESLSQRRSSIYLKGKYREILLPSRLCGRLREYCDRREIRSGPIFLSAKGNPVDRSNILHRMKKLSPKADVPAEKIFPHNLRHFFAVNYYSSDRDIARLADLLGHSDLNTTRIYTRISMEEQISILDQVEKKMNPDPEED
ncbi:MAG: tyrosine-type recombinase/integrase [Lachnospiraceae bacterium]|nr:tyrosine-type recombinase/integrase [Lachnospiraceae bacterium]